MYNLIDNKWIDGIIEYIEPNEIFVFGSNLAGRHGAGAAKQAMKYGAVYGVGSGIMCNTYAIPTKDFNIKTLSTNAIEKYINQFITTAYLINEYSDRYVYLITRIGCGLAGYTDNVMAKLFKACIDYSCFRLPIEWKQYLEG